MNLRLENIKELDSLPPLDRELVIKEYQKEEHPFQIEVKVLSILLCGILYISLEKYLKIHYGLNGYELFSALILVFLVIGYAYRLIEYNFIAPRIIIKLLKDWTKLGKNRPRLCSRRLFAATESNVRNTKRAPYVEK